MDLRPRDNSRLLRYNTEPDYDKAYLAFRASLTFADLRIVHMLKWTTPAEALACFQTFFLDCECEQSIIMFCYFAYTAEAVQDIHVFAKWRAVIDVALQHGAFIPVCFQTPKGCNHKTLFLGVSFLESLHMDNGVAHMCVDVMRRTFMDMVWNDFIAEHFRREGLPLQTPAICQQQHMQYFGLLIAEHADMDISVAVANMIARKAYARGCVAHRGTTWSEAMDFAEKYVPWQTPDGPMPDICLPLNVCTVGDMLSYIRQHLLIRYGVETFEEYVSWVHTHIEQDSLYALWPFSARGAWVSCCCE